MNIRKPLQRERVITDLTGQKSKTDRSSGNDTDINNIVARFQRTGVMPPPTGEPHYGDVSSLQGELTDLIARGEAARQELQELELQKEKEQQEAIRKNQETAEANAKRLAELEKLHAQTQESS